MAPSSRELRPYGRRGRGLRGSGGFTVMEVMVAFSVLLVMIIPAIALVQSSVKVSGDDRNRVVSANLATQQLEITRAMQFAAVQKPGGPDQTWPRQVGLIGYTVHQNTSWINQAASAGPCGTTNSAGPPAVLLVHIWVTWPAMGATSNPTVYSTITPTYGFYSANAGNIAVTLTDSVLPPLPVANVPVTITDGSNNITGPYVTDATGCAYFAYLTPGAYTVKAQRAGFVGQQEETTAATPNPLTLVAGKTLGVGLAYEQGALLPISYPAAVPPPPGNMAITVANGLLKAPGTFTFSPPAGTVLSVLSPLWAFSDGYTVWAGQCPDSKPSVTPPSAAVSEGATTAPAYQVGLSELDVRVANASGVAVTNATVTAVDFDPTCTTLGTYTLAPTLGATTPGMSRTGMPLGTFKVTAAAPGFTLSTTTIVVVGTAGPYAIAVTLS